MAVTRKPEAENDDSGEQNHEDHHVEAAILVGEDVWECSTNEAIKFELNTVDFPNRREELGEVSCSPGAVQDWNQIECHGYRHPVMNRRRHDIVQRNEHPPWSKSASL